MVLLFPSSDEGTLLYGAIRVTKGQIPSRDFFEVMGPGSFYWLAAFFKLFGSNFLASRVCLTLTSLGVMLLMYFLARRLKTGYYAAPAVFLMATLYGHAWPTVSHHTDSTLFALMSFAALACWIDTNRPWLLCLAGVLAGAATLFLQPKGLLIFVSFLLVVVLLRGKARVMSSLLWLTAGYSAVGLAVALLYWKAGALPDLIYANIFWPLENYSGVNAVPYGWGMWQYWASLNTGLNRVSSPVIAAGSATLLTAPQLVIAALPAILVVFALLYRRRAFNCLTLPYWIAGTALWLSELHRKDMANLTYGSPLLIILLFHFLARERRWISRSALRAICVGSFAFAAFNLFLVRYASATKVTTARGGFYMFRPDPVLEFLNSHVKAGEEIFVYPYRPIYYFLTGTENPTRFSILMYRINTDAQFHEAIRSLQKANVKYVLWESRPKIYDGFPAYSPPPSDQLIMEPYLASQYRVLKSFNGIDILERAADLPACRTNEERTALPARDRFAMSRADSAEGRKSICRDPGLSTHRGTVQ